MALVVVICLGLGGWDLLLTYGQWVEAEPAVVGQPIKIRGRFFHFFAGEDSGRYELKFAWRTSPSTGAGWSQATRAKQSNWCHYDVELELPRYLKWRAATEITMILTPSGSHPIHGKFVVPAADDAVAIPIGDPIPVDGLRVDDPGNEP